MSWMRASPLRVLVVDDDERFRALIVTTVRAAGHDVVGEAGDGAEGVRLADELRPDLVTMDLEMPVLDGLGAIEQLGRGPIVVVVSGSATSSQLGRALARGARWHVPKRDLAAQLPGVLEALAAEHARA